MLSGLSVSSDFLHRSKLKGSGGANRSVNFVYVGRETPLGQQNGKNSKQPRKRRQFGRQGMRFMMTSSEVG
jgi:hypothetical protein